MPENISSSFSEAVSNFFQNYTNFSGRTARREFWFSMLFLFIGSTVLAVVGGLFGTKFFQYIFWIATLVPNLSICWRRLHDIGKSGTYFFLVLIPIAGAIILILWFCMDSEPDNQYGPRPVTTQNTVPETQNFASIYGQNVSASKPETNPQNETSEQTKIQ